MQRQHRCVVRSPGRCALSINGRSRKRKPMVGDGAASHLSDAQYRTGFTPIESAVRGRGGVRSKPRFNGLAVECFTDELAHAAGEDPFRFRRRQLQLPEIRARAGRTKDRRPIAIDSSQSSFSPGEGRLGQTAGPASRPRIACTTNYAYLAQVAESPSRTTHPREPAGDRSRLRAGSKSQWRALAARRRHALSR